MSEDVSTVVGATYDRRAEVIGVLTNDDTLIGRMYQYSLEDRTPQEIAAAEGNQNTGFVSNYRTLLEALLDEKVPDSPSMASQAASRVKGWLRSKDLSDDLVKDLTLLRERLLAKTDDVVAKESETEAAVANTKQAEKTNTPGVYVYTLPHYRLHPVEPLTGRTFLKVGHSSKDAYYRADSAKRLTALPEDPILLRIYPSEESHSVEKVFHEWLKDADHLGNRAGRVGSEWFLTSTKFLDRIAATLQLEIREINVASDTVDE